MKAFFGTTFLLVGAMAVAQNHSSANIRMMVEQEHDHIANYDSYSVRVKLFNHSNEVLYEADLFNGRELDETFFYYDDEDNLEYERRIHNSPHESGRIDFMYDDKGHLKEEIDYDNKQRPTYRLTMRYDDKGNMTFRERELDHESEHELYVESSWKYTYDEQGRMKEQWGYENGKPYEDVFYQFWYDNEGLKHNKEKVDDEKNVLERWVEDFSPDNHLLNYKHTIYGKDGKEHVRADVKYTYTSHGDLETETITKEGKVVKEVRFEYSYDNHGNWTTKKEFKGLGDDMKEVAHIQRWIEYYEKEDYPHPPMELDEQFIVKNNMEKQRMEHISAETHVRINNNHGKVVWQVRRNGPTIYQVDYNQYVGDMVIQTKHMNNYGKANYVTNFNYNGNNVLESTESLSFDEKVNSKTAFHYNEQGHLIKKEMMFADMSGGMSTDIVEEYEVDDKGLCHKAELIEYGEQVNIEYVYDKKDEVIAKTVTPKAEGEDSYTERYGYEDGYLVTRDVYIGNSGEPNENDIFEYVNGELVESKFYEKGRMIEVTRYEYFE